MTAPLSAADVRRIATLAHLELSDAEIDLFRTQLSDILEYAGDVQAIDTTGVEATSHVHGGDDRLRDDAPVPSLAPADWIDQAPDAERRTALVRVPKVL